MMHSMICHRSSSLLPIAAKRSLRLSPRQHNLCNATNNLSRHRYLSSSPSDTKGSSGSNIFGKIFFPSLCAITFTLGTWQTKRYFEKIDMAQKRKDDLSLDPLSFEQWRLNNADSESEGSSGDVKSKSYRRVTIQGKFDHTNSILVGPRGPPPGALATTGPNSGMGGGGGMSSSMQGYWVVTPLIVNDESQMNNDDSKEMDSLNEDVSSNEGERKGWWGRLLPWRRRNNNTSSTSDQKLNDLESGSDTDSATGTSSSSIDKATIVWINRGWIPRHYINQNTDQILQSWDEPNEHVTVLSMESQTEKGGGMFTPPSRIDAVGKGGGNLIGASCDKKSVRKLLWMDREAMEEMTNCTDDHPPLFVQINTTADDMKNEPKSFPVQPSDEYVGEFKVTPDVHMGYAVTWFGLSGAGVIMTRKLLTRGR
eukprot:scaffold14322_cov87-Skeletonema_dohrnii-CCMP3373.AAC.4